VPTFKEAGLPDVNLSTWIFLMAPAATPDAVVALLNRTVNDILKQPDTKDKLLQQGFVQSGGSVEEMAQRMKAEATLWGTVIKNANITVQ
jgi:tripartite-type tricarboxylate transporter receptor subunit TctC